MDEEEIGLTDIYRQLVAQAHQLTATLELVKQLTTQVDELTARLDRLEEEYNARLDRHAERIEALRTETLHARDPRTW